MIFFYPNLLCSVHVAWALPYSPDFEDLCLKWWAWLCCRASGPEPSSPSHLPLAPQHESGLTGPLKWWLQPSHSSSHQSHDACLVLCLSPPRHGFSAAASSARWIQECLAAWPCWWHGVAWDGTGWKAGYPGSKGLLILDRRILIYTIRDKSIINPALINCSGNGKELSVQQPGELKTKYNLQEGKRGWVFGNTFLKWNRNLGKVLLSSPHSASLCSEMGVPAFPLG